MVLYITGEWVQQQCQYYLGTQRDFRSTPKISEQIERQIDIDNCETLGNLQFDRLFCYTHIIRSHYDKVYQLLLTTNSPFIFVCHNSDIEFSEKYQNLIEIPNLIKIYTQNLSFKPTPKIKPLPIGMANSQWSHGNLAILEKVRLLSQEKSELVYFWCNIITNRAKRSQCIEALSGKVPFLSQKLHFEPYLKLLSKHHFSICPVGNGMDTHRFWESIYLKVVPICLRSPLTEYFSHYVPVVLLDDWSELDISLLNYENHLFDDENLKKLVSLS